MRRVSPQTILHAFVILLTIIMISSCQKPAATIHTRIFDASAQPPLVGADIEGFTMDSITCKGIIVSEDNSTLTVIDNVDMQHCFDYGYWKDEVQPYRIIDCTSINKEQYWCALLYLKGHTTYYVRAFIKDHHGTTYYGDTQSLTTASFDRYPGFAGYANVYYSQQYTLFDKMTDEIIDPVHDGFYYSSNENPNSCRYQQGEYSTNTNYKFKTEWSYLLWYYQQYNRELQSPTPVPNIHLDHGRVVISAPDDETIYYCINDTTHDPATFTEIYSHAIDLPSGSRIDCYSVNAQGEMSYLNRFWR